MLNFLTKKMNDKITLICTPLQFYTQNDEKLFFSWLKKIKCINSFEGVKQSLHLHINSHAIPNSDLLELMGLFDRYKFDAQQLKVFMNDSNKEWFE
jgi:hypothetical protein